MLSALGLDLFCLLQIVINILFAAAILRLRTMINRSSREAEGKSE